MIWTPSVAKGGVKVATGERRVRYCDGRRPARGGPSGGAYLNAQRVCAAVLRERMVPNDAKAAVLSSWHISDRHVSMGPAWYWHWELRSGAITREEYLRRMSVLAGLPAPEAPSVGSPPPIAVASNGGETGGSELQACGSSRGV